MFILAALNVLFHTIPSTLHHEYCACLQLPLHLLVTSSILTHCSKQVHKDVNLFTGLSIDYYMQVHILFAYPHYFGLLMIHLEAMFSEDSSNVFCGSSLLPPLLGRQHILFSLITGGSNRGYQIYLPRTDKTDGSVLGWHVLILESRMACLDS